MQTTDLLHRRMARQPWWTGILVLLALFLVWSLAADFMFTGPSGEVLSTLLSLLFLAPLTVLCAWRLNDLDRALMPTLALLIAPFVLYSGLTQFTALGARATMMETGVSDTSAVVMAPTIAGWFTLAWLAASLAWMVGILGMRSGQSDLEAGQHA